MSFLTKIDEIHVANQREFGVDVTNGNFSSFINIEPVGLFSKRRFLIKKQEKSKLLLVSGKQRVYLSDYHIISTILSIDKEYIEWFLSAFVKLYNNETKTFTFKLVDEIFEGIGISYHPNPYEIILFSDTVIDINDLIFVLNFIFSKDKQWELDTLIENFSKSTIVKYITLIDYFANKSKRSEKYLTSIGYSTNNPKLSDFFSKNDNFSDVSSFDISKYL